jgi:hypothetical protein
MVGQRRSIVQIFVFPAIITTIVGCGLISALLGDGVWDVLSWVALALPLIVFHPYLPFLTRVGFAAGIQAMTVEVTGLNLSDQRHGKLERKDGERA